MTPADYGGQRVLDWRVDTFTRNPPASFVDSFGNLTHTLVITEPHDKVRIRVRGRVNTRDAGGLVTSPHDPFPIAAYLRETDLTRPNEMMIALATASLVPGDLLETCHRLMGAIRDRVDYRVGATQVETSALEALEHGLGVCQDHAHIFITCARVLGIPARYVSGYLHASEGEGVEYDASHAWAEVFLYDLGWVGFDVSNRVCPYEAYVRVAVGLDYREAAPIRGLRIGGSGETLTVTVRVRQQSEQMQS